MASHLLGVLAPLRHARDLRRHWKNAVCCRIISVAMLVLALLIGVAVAHVCELLVLRPYGLVLVQPWASDSVRVGAV